MFFKPAGSTAQLSLGARGEILALEYLRRERFRILEKNHRSRLGEIDIVAEKKGRLYFVEVKTRSGPERGSGAESVTREKQRRLARLAAAYLQKNKKTDAPVSFAVISILWQPPQEAKISWIDNAFMVE